MTPSIRQLVNELPSQNMTVRLLHGLDWVVPGEYRNLTGWDATVKAVSGVSGADDLRRISERAEQLYLDPKHGYQRAIWIYQTVDSLQRLTGFSALAGKVTEDVRLSSFLERFAPKADTIQAVDFALKVAAEITAYCSLHGVPSLKPDEMTKVFGHYKHEGLMRIAALVCCDGLIPLGPDFVGKTLGLLEKIGPTGLEANGRFQALRNFLPGVTAAEHFTMIYQGLNAAGGCINNFVASRELGIGVLTEKLKTSLDGWEGRLDYLAAILDLTISYFEHTGVQSVARSLVTHAVKVG